MPAVAVCNARLHISLATIPLPDLNNTAPPFNHHLHTTTFIPPPSYHHLHTTPSIPPPSYHHLCITTSVSPPTIFYATTDYIAPPFERHQQLYTLPPASARKPKVKLSREIYPHKNKPAAAAYSTQHVYHPTHFRSPNPSTQQCIRHPPTTWALSPSPLTGCWMTPGLSPTQREASFDSRRPRRAPPNPPASVTSSTSSL
jgi:hypothetical protein